MSHGISPVISTMARLTLCIAGSMVALSGVTVVRESIARLKRAGWTIALAGIAAWLPATLAEADTVPAKIETNAVFMQPMPGLTGEAEQQFRAGETMFRTVWLVFPAMPVQNNWQYMRPTGGYAWGLGPTFIANSCMACRVQAGRGKTVEQPNSTVFQQLLRVSLPGTDAHGGPLPHPDYGGQLQVFDAISADRQQVRQGEADVFVEWLPESVTLPDGEAAGLRRPKVRVESLSFGPLGDEVLTSLRNAPSIFGLGYLESVSEEDILRIAAAQRAAGLNGRPNYVRDDVHQRMTLGRFGWKANQPGVRQQIAAALLNDMGITSSLYPKQNCPPVQTDCRKAPPGDTPELFADEFDNLTLWVQALDAPPRRDRDRADIRRGEALFEQARCAECHLPQMKTGANAPFPALANRVFHPYTDLLVHDMGEGLSDGRPDFHAGGRDWRTAPLWGIGLSKPVNGSTNLLHDGRARNVAEAILWHGGEAKPSRDAFARLGREDRNALVAFVNSL